MFPRFVSRVLSSISVAAVATFAAVSGPAAAAAPSPALRAALAADPQLGAAANARRAQLPLGAKNDLRVELGSGAYPVVPSFLAGLALATANPGAIPPGANVPGCTLTSRHPYPVVLVHGTIEDMEDNWGAVAPILANAGYCVYALNYGGPAGSTFQATGPVAQSAQTVAAYFDAVRAATHAAKIDVLGHSQGGTVLEYAAKFLGEAPHIDKLVAVTPSTHGTTASGILTLAKLVPGANAVLALGCQACVDQEIGSPVLRALDAPPIAQPGPAYTVIETLTDEVITPPAYAFIAEPGVTNEYIQQFCPLDPAEHLNVNYDLVSIQLMLNALDPATARPPDCLLAFPIPA